MMKLILFVAITHSIMFIGKILILVSLRLESLIHLVCAYLFMS